ncbi:MAG: ubiquinol-cytochrome C chaperone family protein [Magnetococcus sp. MYC-9]
MHDRIVDQVLRLTAEKELASNDAFILRFDVMILFVSAVLRRLHQAGPDYHLCAQMVWDITFEGLEESLRNRGVSDLRLASRMRTLLQNATGRRNAYLAAWEEQDGLRSAIGRNVFNGAEASDPRIDRVLANLPGFADSVLGPLAPLPATTHQKGIP